MRRIFTILVFSLACIITTSASISIADTVTASCNNSGSVKLGASGGTAPYLFWIRYGAQQSSGVFTGLGPGNYTFFVTDATGVLDSITVGVNNTFSVTAAYNSTTKKITTTVTGGTAPYKYFWPGFYNGSFSDSSYIANSAWAPIFSGQYLVQVKDNNGCLAADSVTTSGGAVTGNTSIKHGVSCYAQQDDSVVFDGGSGDSYQVGGTEPIGDIPNNVYPITGVGYNLFVDDDNNNDLSASYFHYYSPMPLHVSGTVNKAGSTQQQNGSVSLFAWGGQGHYTYHWANGTAGASATGLAPGSYLVTVTEIGGCSVSANFTVGPPVLSDTAIGTLCYGDSTGQVNLGAIGAAPPYYFHMQGSSIAEQGRNFDGLPAGTYTFFVTDSTGAQDSVSATINQPQPISANATIVQPDSGVADGFISLSPTGGNTLGTGIYHYKWSAGNSNQNYLSGLFPGIYSVVITDANGCTATQTFNLSLTGVNELSVTHITLQPNPTNGIVTINGLSANQTLVIYDATGRMVNNMPATGTQQIVDLSAQAAGLYLFRVMSATGTCLGQAKVLRK